MPLNLNIDSLKKELTVSSVKSRAGQLNDRYSSPSSSTTSYGRAASSSSSTSTSTGRPLAPPRAPSSSSSVSANRIAAPPPAATLPPRRVAGGPVLRERVQEQEQEQEQEYYQDSANGKINWQNITANDKRALFSALDAVRRIAIHGGSICIYTDEANVRIHRLQVFAGQAAPSSALRIDPRANVVAPVPAPPTRQTQTFHSDPKHLAAPSEDGPPPPSPAMWARPGSTSAHSVPSSSMSYPPRCSSSSHAADTAAYFSSSSISTWSSPWFLSDSPLPPPLANRADMTWSSSWQQRGNAKVLIGTALFCDLSVAWWKVQWDVQEEQTRGFAQSTRVRREAKYLDCPDPLPAEQLWDACSTYGEQVAQFAERAEQGGVPIARGTLFHRLLRL